MRDGAFAPLASIARSYDRRPADASTATLVSHADSGIHSMPRSVRRSSSSDSDAPALWSRRMPLSPVGTGSSAGRVVGEQVDVGVDPLLAGLAEGEDPQRDPRVVGGDRDVDRRPVADLLAALGGGVGVEGRGEEDRAAAGVEVEDLGRVGREPEAVVLGPGADVGGAALEDGDVEGVDPDLHQLLGAGGRGAASSAARNGCEHGGSVSRMRRWSVQSPPFSTLDGTPGSGVIEPNAPPPPAN